VTHHPAVEHYPVLSTHLIGFKLHPMGFFDTNPALDAPNQRGE
jgi:Cu2+-containing amine oxidase